jgi:lipoprotein NlpD
MRNRNKTIRILILFFLGVFLFSCSIQIRDSVKSSDRARGVYHRVKPGETLWRISKAYHVDLQDLAEVNNITDAARIEAGSVVFIPDVREVIDLPPVKPPAETRTVASRPPDKPASVRAEPENGRSVSTGAGVSTSVAVVGGRSSVKEESISDRSAAPKTERTAATVRPAEKPAPEVSEKVDSYTTAAGKTQAPAKPTVLPPPLKTPDGSAKEKAESTASAKKPEPLQRDEDQNGKIRMEKGRFLWPVKGPVITRFGIQPSGMKYNGVKIAAKEGTPVSAAAAGTIIYSSYVKGYGDTIIVKHDENYTTVYAYLKGPAAKKDDRVKKGEKIASVGLAVEPGGEPHLYFEIREKNKARNPLFFLP